MLLYISGFMGSGKSSFLKSWQDDFGDPCFDFDEQLASLLGVAADQLGSWIESEGWEAFRLKERELLLATLRTGTGLYALGGGSLHSNLDLIETLDSSGTRLWVNTPIEVCWSRVENDANRPLVQKGKSAFFDLFASRREVYESANISISGEIGPPSWEKFCNKYRDRLKLD